MLHLIFCQHTIHQVIWPSPGSLRPTLSIMYVPLHVNIFHESILLIFQYKYLKSFTGFITQCGWVFYFQKTTLVLWKWFVPQLYQFRRGILGVPALTYFYMIHRGGCGRFPNGFSSWSYQRKHTHTCTHTQVHTHTPSTHTHTTYTHTCIARSLTHIHTHARTHTTPRHATLLARHAVAPAVSVVVLFWEAPLQALRCSGARAQTKTKAGRSATPAYTMHGKNRGSLNTAFVCVGTAINPACKWSSPGGGHRASKTGHTWWHTWWSQ